MKYFMFLDESGEADINTVDPRFNTFVLCGILFSEISYKKFDEDLKKLKLKFWNNTNVVFHSTEMRSQNNAFKIFQDKKVLESFYVEIERILRGNDYRIIACIIDKLEYKTRYPNLNYAYEDCLTFLSERSVRFIRNIDKKNTLHLCLEKRGKRKDVFLKKRYTKIIKYGTEFVSTNEFLSCDTKLYFRDKQENTNGLQLADICAYPIARQYLSPNKVQPTFEIIKEHILNYKGKMYGLKRFP